MNNNVDTGNGAEGGYLPLFDESAGKLSYPDSSDLSSAALLLMREDPESDFHLSIGEVGPIGPIGAIDTVESLADEALAKENMPCEASAREKSAEEILSNESLAREILANEIRT